MLPINYAPKAMQSYRLADTESNEVKEIQKLGERGPAVWNLFWLSTPAIDNVPGSGSDWWRVYKPVPGVLARVIADVFDDEVLYRKLTMPPIRFFTWFARERDHSIYDTYEVLNGKEWVNTVLHRAEEAADRMHGFRPLSIDWKTGKLTLDAV